MNSKRPAERRVLDYRPRMRSSSLKDGRIDSYLGAATDVASHADLGGRKLERRYPRMKITFVAGKVANVE